MKKICIPLMGILLSPAVRAQDSGWHLSYTTGAGYLFALNTTRALSTSFPYATTATVAQQTFTGNLKGAYNSQVPMFEFPFNIDVSHRRFDFTLGMGAARGFSNDYDGYFHAGLSYAIPLHGVTLKPGFDMVSFSASEGLGGIDNLNQTLTMFYFQSGGTFDISNVYFDDNGNAVTSDQTYNIDHLDVNYTTHCFDLGPRIDLDLKPIGRFTFGAQADWLFPVSQGSSLQFVQVSNDNGGATNNLATVDLSDNGGIGGPFVGVHADIRIGHIPKS